jgi:coenzyme F420 biosynthesis associated uncharacterized protein
MVDWSIARHIARLAAGSERMPDLGLDLAELARRLEPEVAAHTGLVLSAPAPPVELLRRAEWTEVNLETLAPMLDPVSARLDQRLATAGRLAGPLRVTAGATVAAEFGLVLGYVSTRVLGQYEVSLLGQEVAPRLLFIPANLEKAIHELDVDRESFLGWIVIHELTHCFQFQGVGWLRDHLRGLVREYLQTVEVRIERGAAGTIPGLPDLGKLVEAFREGGLAALVQTGEQRRLMRRMQATMAVIEGYSEHVMDALGPRLLRSYGGLREAMDRRRASRGAPERMIARLLGLDLKLRQYELGKRFCDAVAELGGTDAVNRVWTGPDALPSLAELSRPAEWLARVERGAAAAV